MTEVRIEGLELYEKLLQSNKLESAELKDQPPPPNFESTREADETYECLPERNYRHEWYVRGNGKRIICRSCGITSDAI